MKMKKIFLLIALIFLFTSCAGTFNPKQETEELTIKENSDGSKIIKYSSNTFDGSRKFGPLNLAKAKNTNPDNAVNITSTANTKVSTRNINSNRRTEKNSSPSGSKKSTHRPGSFSADTQDIVNNVRAKKENRKNVGTPANSNNL